MIKSATKIKVPFNDLDPMNIVWHGNYVKYLEQARGDLFNMIGYSYFDMYADNYIYPIAKLDMKFIKSIAYDDEIEVRCILQEIEPAIIISYEIYNGAEKIFKAKSTQIGVLANTKESIYKAPPKLIEKIKEYENAQ